VDNDPDLALIERYRKGDTAAFTELVIRYQRPIYNASFWILRKAEDANDITQIVFLKVAERLDEYDPRSKFFSWITGLRSTSRSICCAGTAARKHSMRRSTSRRWIQQARSGSSATRRCPGESRAH
jgi:RNA polymerase sigma factor (sigma-70 family)